VEEKAMSTDGIGVLVGVDESACSQQALAWAAADALAKGLPLTVAGAVDLPHHPDIPLSGELVGSAEAAVRRRSRRWRRAPPATSAAPSRCTPAC
jgi:nucleotide-binding universal stress UspA family protein